MAGAVLAATAVVLLTGCQTGPSPTPSVTGPAVSQQSASRPVGSQPDSLGLVVDPNHSVEDAQPEPVPLPSPTSDAGSDAAAADTATAVMTAFARRDAPQGQWWAGVSVHLSDTARQVYSATDPANVPAGAVTGPPELAPSESGFLATLGVPTDAGVYQVLLSRAGQYAPWVVEQLTPPDGLN